ncbi:DUF2225 domain-containing protein [Paenibacillus agricola]|uniref:DUF2225 domain-containing protein n=1 Tax=Paenibacillus agricola TaxID=2716264 RepID=A0ABX0JFL9_9BACL|nr:DUF2225 domain-containing protein [Paenibacillus agricola]NHN33493.1 DUF2225 domain-containing protein [Paenibacillus agricola]
MAVEPLYQIKVECAYCKVPFQTSRVRPSFKKVIQTDTDFCAHYKGTNPDFYVVRVCPSCGYASTENAVNEFNAEQLRAIHERVTANWTYKDYGNERTWDEAMHTYKLALICAQLRNEKGRVIAGLLHHIAWLYRYKNDEAQEKRFLQFALDAYTTVLESETAELNNARLMYLMGELNRRLKNYAPAVKWFARVINDKRIIDAGMITASRNQWFAVREDMLAEKLELPPELMDAQKS